MEKFIYKRKELFADNHRHFDCDDEGKRVLLEFLRYEGKGRAKKEKRHE